MEGFVCAFLLIWGKGGSVLQNSNNIIYSFLHRDFHPLIDGNFSISIILGLFYSVLFFFLLMVIHLLICSLLLQRVLNIGPYQTMILAPALASGKDAQEWQCRAKGYFCFWWLLLDISLVPVFSDHPVNCIFHVLGLFLYAVVWLINLKSSLCFDL